MGMTRMKKSNSSDISVYLSPAEYVDSAHPRVLAKVNELTGMSNDLAAKAIALFGYVRDLRYSAPDFDRLDSFRASTMLAEGKGYCVPKACAFVALARAAGIPARLAFADVTNHIVPRHTRDLMQGATFAWHGYAEILLDHAWLKVSPTFDRRLCEKLHVAPLEFDGVHDAHLQAFDQAGRAFMRYEHLHGTFHDVPARFLAAEMPRRYPLIYQAIKEGRVR